MIEVTIKDEHSSETAVHRYDNFPWHEFQWSEGNYSCDCNRSLLFARALGRDEPDDPVCGEDRFSVTRVVVNGSVIYDGPDLRGGL